MTARQKCAGFRSSGSAEPVLNREKDEQDVQARGCASECMPSQTMILSMRTPPLRSREFPLTLSCCRSLLWALGASEGEKTWCTLNCDDCRVSPSSPFLPPFLSPYPLSFPTRFPFLEPPSMTNIETAIGFLKEQVCKMQTEEKMAPEKVCVAMVTYTQSCTLEVI